MSGIETLVDQSPFGRLGTATRKRIADRARLVAVNAGAMFFTQGDPPTGLFALQEGRVKLLRQSRARAQILAIPLPGECFGAESFPTGAPSPYTAITIGRASALYIAPEILGPLLEEHADLQELFLELVANRLRQLVSLVHDLAFRDVTSRLAGILAARARTEGCTTDEGITLDRLFSQEEFAAMVGTAREVVCRIFKKFESAELVRLSPQRIHILDLDGLQAIAAQEVR